MPSIGDIKHELIRISNSDLGYISEVSGGTILLTQEVVLKVIKKKFAEKLAANLIPGLGVISGISMIITATNHSSGYDGFEITLTYKYKKLITYEPFCTLPIETTEWVFMDFDVDQY